MHTDLIANRYKPLFLRARGGFASVEVAWDTKLTRRVAIKRIDTGRSLPLSSLEEARTLALLSSPNIVNVYDFEHTGSETLMVMENVDGPSLAELMADSTELLDIDVATAILDGIVTALDYAHENQVLHLDIKPGNILIDQSGHVKVSDFGLAELAGSNGFGEVQGGTIGYMPPEQLAGGSVDMRTDIWALAALSYQLLTGVNPFFALSPRESLHYITSAHYALPSELRPELGGAVDEALIKALHPEPTERPATVTEFWLEIRPFLGKVTPGRRRLKTLVRAWASKETALLEGVQEGLSDTDADDADEYFEGAEDDFLAKGGPSIPDDEPIAIWNGNYEGETEETWAVNSSKRKQQRAERKTYKRENRKERARLEPKDPLWQRISPHAQAFIGRCFSGLAIASMVWLALSSLPYLSGPVAQAATAAATNTGNATPALLDAAFGIRLAITLVAAIVGFITPGIGAALAVLALVLGIFFTGNWLVGFMVLALGVVWWIYVGRHGMADAAIFPLSSLLLMLSMPMLTPLLAGYFLNWKRALGTAAFSCFICSLVSIISYGSASELFFMLASGMEVGPYGQFSLLPSYDLLGAGTTLSQMPDSNQLFIPLISLFTSVEFWLVLAGWMGAAVSMSLLIGGKSRVKYVIAVLCGAAILTVGYLLPVFFSGTDTMVVLAATSVRLALAVILCLLLVAIGV